jgi:hypothetical protein
MAKRALFVSFLICISSMAFAQNAGSFRDKEPWGMGFGYEGPGTSIFLDYGINETVQLHFFVAITTTYRYQMETNHSLGGLTVRFFPNSDSGFFMGIGGGSYTADQKVEQDIYCYQFLVEDNPPECNGNEGNRIDKETESTYTASSAWGTIGWQGHDGFYFTIGLMAGSNFGEEEEDNTDKLIDHDDDIETAKEDWKAAKSGPSGGIVSFGWHF